MVLRVDWDRIRALQTMQVRKFASLKCIGLNVFNFVSLNFGKYKGGGGEFESLNCIGLRFENLKA